MPNSAIQTDPDAIARTTLADVQSAAARYARLDKASLLLIGDRGKIEEGVRSLNVHRRLLENADGSPVSRAGDR